MRGCFVCGMSLLAFATMVCDVAAQNPLVPGARIRLSIADEGTRDGTLDRVTGDTLWYVLEGGRTPRAVSFGTIDRLAVSAGGKNNVLRGLLIGTGTGIVLGAGAGAFTCRARRCDEIGTEGGAIIFGAIGGVAGLVVGTLIGVATTHETWVRVALPSRLSWAPTRGAVLGWSVAW